MHRERLRLCLLAACLLGTFSISLGGSLRERRDSEDRPTPGDSGHDHGPIRGRGLGHGPLPAAVHMDVPMSGGPPVRLNLERSPVIDATLPVFIGTGRHAFVQMDNRGKEDFAVYQDTARNASFVLWNRPGESSGAPGQTAMRGIFDTAGETFSMEPLERGRLERPDRDAAAQDAAEPPVTIVVNDMEFAMYKVNKSDTLAPIQEQVVTPESEALREDVEKYINMTQEQGHAFPRYSYQVEVLMVVDYAIFTKFLRTSTAIYYETREREAIDDIRFYFAHILNGVAMRYKSVADSNFEINIKPIGLYIAKTPEASYWTELPPAKEAFHFTEAYRALDLFEAWINDEESNLPPFDQATLFTSNNLFSGYYDGRRRTINGLANIKAVCSYYRVAINYDQGQYGSIQNAAHEMGHNLGAYHDGHLNECQSADQYIMATSPGSLNSGNFQNTFAFSYCTKRAFYEYLLYLNSQGGNCLLEESNYPSNWDHEYHLQEFPGQRYTADEQCKLVYGPQSSYCGGGHLDEAICSLMYCWRPSENQCHVHVEQRAADATTCGDGKWCMEGRCVADSRAPATDRTECLYGDFLDVVDFGKNYKCSDIGRLSPNRCYDDPIREECCQTCEDLRNDEVENCEFGDRNPEYCRTIEDRDCYGDGIRQECCQTCASRMRDSTTCRFGDRATFSCRDARSTPRDCYHSNATCCETCPSLATGPAGCEWGDKVSWCSGIRLRECYRKDYVESCCATCQPTGPRGCEFGDRSTNCANRDCRDPNAQRECCQTCGTGSPATTTTRPPSGSSCSTADSADCSYRIQSGRDCYNEESNCCNECSRYLTGDSTCKYGDRYSWCPDYVRRNKGRVCLDSNDAYVTEGCCASCQPYMQPGPSTEAPAANCFDDAQWCSDIHPSQCYDVVTEETCCATCARLRRSGSCRYGDMYTWCKPQYCDRHATECCDTC